MFDYVELLYRDQVLERHYGESMELLNDLQVPQAKQQVLQDLLGKGLTSNLASYYIRLPFSTNLPLCAMSTHPLVRFKFRQIGEFSGAQWTGPVTMYLFVDYVYVTDAERDMFRSKEMDYMTHTFQRLEFQVGPNITTVPILTEFIDDVTELFWVIQTDGTPAYNYTNDGQDQLVSLSLRFDGVDIILSEIGTPLYLGSVQPLTYHTRSPDRKFYIYSFGLDPEDPQSTGQINFSKIIKQLHTLQLSPCAFSRQVRIYARTTRVLHLRERELYVDNRIAEAGSELVQYNSGNKNHYPGLYYFDTFTFTTLGASGRRGPASTLTYANAPWSSNQFSIVDGQQYWTVPATGTYSITAAGAYGAKTGRVVSGNLNLTQGQVLKMLVGQLPSSNVQDNMNIGGGGGTFVTSGGTPLIVASGGDGTGGSVASFSPYGTGLGVDGAGYSSNGAATSATYLFLKPTAYVYGGFGNSYIGGLGPEEGGFGGGQSPKVSGISGGGGYTGSPGTGASGATCYAATSVSNFTDLGATSNTAGYVTVSLVNPVPLKYTWSWDPTKQWTMTNAIASGLSTPVWSFSLGLFISVANYSQLLTSPDGITWSVIQTNLPVLSTYNNTYKLVASTSGVLLVISPDTGYVYRSTDASNWTLSLSVSISINQTSSVFINNLFILKRSNNVNIYTSPDGITWTIITPDIMFSTITYGNSKYVMTAASDYNMYTSVNLVTWSPVLDSNVATSTNGWGSALYDSQTFVVLRIPSVAQPNFQTTYYDMSPRPVVGTPITNITSLTFTGSWQTIRKAIVGDTLTFASISGFLYTISPATYGTVTASSSGSVTVSIVSSTITSKSPSANYIILPFVQNGTTYPVVTSSDGTNWYGRTTPSGNWGFLLSGGGNFIAINSYQGTAMYSLDKGVTWALTAGSQGPTFGSYSPTLNYFLFTEGNIYYLSINGSIIVPSVSGGTVGNPLQLIWADTLGILVAVSALSILISSDGNNWKLVLNINPSGGSSGYISGATVTWSRELGLLVAYFRNTNTNNSPLLYTSSDGITWSRTVLAQAFPQLNLDINPCKPSWSSQLGLFTIGKANSHDGINWTFGSGPNLVCAAWSPSLKMFVGNDGTNSYYSTDGLSWMTSSSYVMYSIAWSPTLKLFVGVGEQTTYSTPFLIYTSTNGTSWTQVYSDVASSARAWYGNITWSPELNVFICAYQQTTAINGMRVLISSDGNSWTSPGSNIINAFDGGDLIWSPDLKIFLFTSQRSQAGMLKSLTAIKTFA
jgi:hypothetical protein